MFDLGFRTWAHENLSIHLEVYLEIPVWNLLCVVLIVCTPFIPFLARITLSLEERYMYFMPAIVMPLVAIASTLLYLAIKVLSSSGVTCNNEKDNLKIYFKVCRKKLKKVAWIWSHHLQWKFKLWAGKFPRQNIAGNCQQVNKKFVDITQQCFALFPEINFPANNLNFHWKWRWLDQIQATF